MCRNYSTIAQTSNLYNNFQSLTTLMPFKTYKIRVNTKRKVPIKTDHTIHIRILIEIKPENTIWWKNVLLLLFSFFVWNLAVDFDGRIIVCFTLLKLSARKTIHFKASASKLGQILSNLLSKSEGLNLIRKFPEFEPLHFVSIHCNIHL